jgi:hypothetical protein
MEDVKIYIGDDQGLDFLGIDICPPINDNGFSGG